MLHYRTPKFLGVSQQHQRCWPILSASFWNYRRYKFIGKKKASGRSRFSSHLKEDYLHGLLCQTWWLDNLTQWHEFQLDGLISSKSNLSNKNSNLMEFNSWFLVSFIYFQKFEKFPFMKIMTFDSKTYSNNIILAIKKKVLRYWRSI